MRILGLIAVAAGALAAVQIASPALLAQEKAEGGTVIQVGPERGVSVDVDIDGEQAQSRRDRRRDRRGVRGGLGNSAPVAVTRYWIGIAGGAVPPELRAQVDLEPGEGVLIRSVTPGGPAAEAGVQQYDLLVRANGQPVRDLNEVAELVGEQGELKGRITLDLLRSGRPETVWVTPAERPADQPLDLPNNDPRDGRRQRFGRLFGPGGGLGGEGLEGLFGPGGMQLDGDLLGGEGLGGLGEMLPELAGMGVSVQVQRQNEGPAQVTVQQGERTWQFDEGDEDALNALPADVKPMVERMLGGNGRAAGQDFDGFGFGGPGFQMQFGGDELAGRMRALQERMMGLRAGAPAAGDAGAMPEIEIPEIEIEEPGIEEAEPIEIEIPEE